MAGPRGRPGPQGPAGAAGAAGAAGSNGVPVGIVYPMATTPPWWSGVPYYRLGAISRIAMGGTTVKTADTLEYAPFMLGRRGVIDRIGLQVSAAVAASNVRLGIYACTATLKPGALMVDSGLIATATTGFKEANVNLQLEAGVPYWYAIAYSAAITVNNVNSSGFNESWFGQDPTNVIGTPQVGAQLNRAFAALPDPGSDPTTPGGSPALVCVRFSAVG